MKTPKPGQLCSINNVTYRARKRTHECTGCSLSNIFMCPNIGTKKKELECDLNNIILVRI